MLARSAVKAARSTGSNRARTRPASMRENSSSVFTSFSSRRLLRCATSSCSCDLAPASASPGALHVLRVGPSISVSGVRNSWLTLLKNAVFARSISASASRAAAPPRRPGLREAGGDLADEQVDEAAIGVVERPVRIEPGDEHPGGRFCPGCAIGTTSACVGGSGHGAGRQRARHRPSVRRAPGRRRQRRGERPRRVASSG